MSPAEVFDALILWTPFLAGGFLLNIVISLVAMAIGTIFGAALACMRLSQRTSVAQTGIVLTEIARNIPTFVFLFYVAFLIPVEFRLGDQLISFPAWLKASLALSIAVIGFVSDNLKVAIKYWRNEQTSAALLFIPSWTAYLLIIIMASSTGSVIGANEIVSRCNIVVTAISGDAMMLWAYLYTALWFFLFCFPLNLLMRRLKTSMQSRIRARS